VLVLLIAVAGLASGNSKAAPQQPAAGTIGSSSHTTPPQSAEPAARWHNVYPDYHKVRMLNASSGWVVGDSGVIKGYANGKWREYASPVTANLQSVYPVGQSDAWAVGDNNTILHFINGDWVQVAAARVYNLPNYYRDIWMVSASDGWIVGGVGVIGGDGVLLHYSAGSWQPVALPSGIKQLNAIQMLSANEGWAVGINGEILHYSQGQWQAVNSPTPDAIFSIAMLPNGSEGWAGIFIKSPHNYTIHYRNGVWTTSSANAPTSRRPQSAFCNNSNCWSYGFAVAALSPEHRLVAGADYDPAITDTGMQSSAYATGVGSSNYWAYQGYTEAYSLYSIAMVAANDAWLVGSNGLIYRFDGQQITLVEGASYSTSGFAYNQVRNELYQVGSYGANPTFGGRIEVVNVNSGATVVSCATPVTSDIGWASVATLPSSNLEAWAVGNSGHLAHITSTGCEVSQLGSAFLLSIAWAYPASAVAVGSGGTLLVYNGTWHIVGNLGTSDLRGVAYSSGRWWAVGLNGAIYTTAGDPMNLASWSLVPNVPTSYQLFAVSAAGNNQAWAVGIGSGVGGVRLHLNGGVIDHTQNGGNSLSAIYMISADEGWAGDYFGANQLERYSGGAWQVVANNIAASALVFRSSAEGWVSSFTMNAAEGPNTLSDTGRLFHYYAACYDYYNDVTEGSWAYSYIHDLSCRGVINGTSSHTFSPNAPATRSQFAKIITLARGWAVVTPSAATFSDVGPGNPLWQFVETAYQHGAVSGAAPALCTARGRANPCYLPDDPISRVQATVIVARAFAWPVNTSGGPHFTDLPPTGFGYAAVETAYNRAVVSGIGGGLFAPNASVSRAQISKIVDLSIYSP